MAAPSQVPSHAQAEVVDGDGDAFPSQSTFHIFNVGSKTTQALAFDPKTREINTTAPSDDNQWMVEHHDTRGRWQIAIKLKSNGKYLAATSPKSGTPFWLSDKPQYWYVYAGSQPNTLWLSTLQSTNGFLYRHEQAGVTLMTWDSKEKPQLDEQSAGMSWRFEGTREYLKTKYAQQRAESQQAKEDLEKRTKELEDRELAAKKHRDETDAHAKKATEEGELLTRTGLEESEAKKKKIEDELTARETKLKAAEQVAKKKQDELTAREVKVTAAEDRIKQSKKAGPAELLKSEQEKERLVDELSEQVEKNRALDAEKQSLKDDLQRARAELEKAGSTTPSQAAAVGLSRPKAAGMPGPQIKRPKEVRPPMSKPPTKRPATKVPPTDRPATVVPASTRPATVVPDKTRPPTEVSSKVKPEQSGESVTAAAKAPQEKARPAEEPPVARPQEAQEVTAAA